MRRASRSAFGFAGRKTGTGPFSGIMATLSFLRRIGAHSNGGVAELAYAADLKSAAARLVGSSPTAPTRSFANQAPCTVCFVASSEGSTLLQERPKGASPSLKTFREKQCAPSALMLVSALSLDATNCGCKFVKDECRCCATVAQFSSKTPVAGFRFGVPRLIRALRRGVRTLRFPCGTICQSMQAIQIKKAL